MSSSSEWSPQSHDPLQEKGDKQPAYPSPPRRSISDDVNAPSSAINPVSAPLSLHSPPMRPLAVPELAAEVPQQPIPPPSEPLQYRAIGLVRGRYTPSETQLNRGTLFTLDGTSLDAVLLGRVISLVKNHLDLSREHLWVVYPRTSENKTSLHLQILGVWEPEELGQSAEVTSVTAPNQAPLRDGYFSIRGEVVYQSQDQKYVVVKIQQSPRKRADQPKSFKLRLEGILSAKAVGYFWDLDVQRHESGLTIKQGSAVAVVPPKKTKRPTKSGGASLKTQKRFSKPIRARSSSTLSAPEQARRGVERPIKPTRRVDS